MREDDVLIVGAGPTGLTLAIELKRFGVPFRLIDKAEHAAKWSQALVVQARTLEQLERYGLANRFVNAGRKLQRARFFSEGKEIVSIPLDKIRSLYPYVLFLPQSDTERMLIEHLRELGGEIERGAELMWLRDRGDTYTYGVQHRDGISETASARWIAGCDGAHSKVREEMHVPFGGEQVDMQFYLGDLQLEGPDKLGDELRVYLRGGDVVFLGRLSDHESRVIVALHEKQNGDDENKELTLDDFQGPIDRAGIRLRVTSSSWMTPFNVNDRQAAHIRINRAFLAGDASHIHSPVGGQGMNTGMQDVANLAWKLAAVQQGANSSLLDSYERERGEVGEALLERTSRALKLATTTNPLVATARDHLGPLLSRVPLVQDAALGFISETAIFYHDSAMVVNAGGTGSLRAGDRMPNIDLGSYRLLDPLRSAGHLALAVECSNEPAIRNAIPKAHLVAFQAQGQLREFCGPHTLVVVRPDGYIGYRGADTNIDTLHRYARMVGLLP
ncbi:MAG TPA: FAD-dependent monooxygenase [Bryobacteraceae bacterium]|nr:FAD-dependent monooxygenase [Bryobacteraceae bacterium]